MRLPPARLETVLLLLPITLLVGTNVPFLEAGGRTLSIGTNELTLALLMGGLLFRFLRGCPFPPLPRNLMLAVALYSLMLPVSLLANILFTGDMPAGVAWIEVVRWYEYLPVLPAVIWLVQSNRQTEILLRLTGFFTLVNVVVALYQAATFDVSASRVYGLFISAANREGASVSNPNVLGSVFMGGALFFLTFALAQTGRNRLWNLLFMGASIVAMALSLSRSAMIGFLVGVVVLSFFYREQRKMFLAIGLSSLVTLGLTVVISDIILTRLLNTLQLTSGTVDAEGVTGRFQAWSFLFQAGLDNPIFGLGFGDLLHRTGNSGYTTADNFYVDTFAMMGVLGCAALGNLFWQAAGPIARAPIAPQTFAYIVKSGYLACFAAFLVDMTAAGLLLDPHLQGLFWMLTGLACQTARMNAKEGINY